MHEQIRNSVNNSTIHGGVYQARNMTVYQGRPPATEVHWPVVSGRIPPKASAFQPREQLRQAIDAAREQCGTIVLSQVLAGGGGVGKSQLAAHYAREAVDSGVELVLWVDAAEPASVTDQYARAALAVGAPGVTGKAEEDAELFLSWLAATDRSWLIVLDNATDQTTEDLWPATSRGGRGRVIATTRHRGAASTGGDRRLVDIGTYSATESASYFRERMARAACAHLIDGHAVDLAEALGHLPLALAHAAAYLINTRSSSGRYLRLFRDRTRSLDNVLPARSGADGYRRPITAALLLSLDAAQEEEPAGLARPALELAALLDPEGHPQALWATRSVLDHLSGIRRAPVDADEAFDALAVLHNYNLLTLTDAPSREVTLHALTARAALDATPEDSRPYRVAADGMAELWPEGDHNNRDLAATLRTNTEALLEISGDLLWDPSGGVHQALHRAGLNLINAGLYTASTRYWNKIVEVNERILGNGHLDTITARTNLAFSHHGTGKVDEAIRLGELVLADAERNLGISHPETLTAGTNLAAYYQLGERLDQAIDLQERIFATAERALGADHPHTLVVLGNLATIYRGTGRATDAVGLREQALVNSERIQGPHHPHTLTAKHNLAISYQDMGRTDEAVVLLEGVVADRKRVLGSHHPGTFTSTSSLASAYMDAGRTGEAIKTLEDALAESDPILGSSDPVTIMSMRQKLAQAYIHADRADDAVAVFQRLSVDAEHAFGPDDPGTLITHASLAVAYNMSGRTQDAARSADRAVTEHERVLGFDHPTTIQVREAMAPLRTTSQR